MYYILNLGTLVDMKKGSETYVCILCEYIEVKLGEILEIILS
jgi:hypothetical protein